MSGSGRYRKMWINYYDDIDCLVFVIDRTDIKRYGCILSELKDIRNMIEEKKIPFIVVFNISFLIYKNLFNN